MHTGALQNRCQYRRRTSEGTLEFFKWEHYPTGDVCDHSTHAQFNYNDYPRELISSEQGHFQLYLWANVIPYGISSVALPDYEEPLEPNDDLLALIAVLMDSSGPSIRLFSTNIRVIGET